MTTETGHASSPRRIAIMAGAGFVPGMNAVVAGAALAAGELGWELVGIRDGFDGLLYPGRYPEGGLVTLSPQLVESLDPGSVAGAGFVPGMNAVVMGAALAAGELGWELVGIRDGFDGVLHPERYPDGGLVTLSPQLAESLDPGGRGILGQSGRVDPFHVRTIDEDEMVQEVDMSDDLLSSAEGRADRCRDLRRGRPGAEHSLQAPSQGAQYCGHPPLDRERRCRHRRVLWLQQRAQLHHRNARPGA